MASNEVVNQLNKLLQKSNVPNSQQKMKKQQGKSQIKQQKMQQQLSYASTLNNQKIKSRLSFQKEQSSLFSQKEQNFNKSNMKYFMNGGQYIGKKFKSIEHEEENKENFQKILIESPTKMNVQIQSQSQKSEKLQAFKQLICQIHNQKKAQKN